jgi:hypothetical protein
MKFNWGTGIVLVIIVFVLGMGALVYITFQNSINLVHEDYYPRELEHQSMIERRDNALELDQRVTIDYAPEIIEVRFPKFFDYDKLIGEIQLFRPSSGIKDVFILVKTDQQGIQRIPTNGLDQGKYIVKIEWEAEGVYYYTEKEIYVKHQAQ